jgi:hypothetical protein
MRVRILNFFEKYYIGYVHIFNWILCHAKHVLSQPNHYLNIAQLEPEWGVLAPGSAHAWPSTNRNFTLSTFGPSKVQAHPWWVMEKNGKKENCLKLPDLARKLIRKLFGNFTPPPRIFSFCFEKTRKVLRILWFGEKVDQTNFLNILQFLFFCEKKTKSV